MGFSYEQVEAACMSISSKGGRVTNESVRAVLGGGSFSDIAPHVRTWKERNRQTQVDETLSTPVEVPLELQQRGQELVKSIWDAAYLSASEQENSSRIKLLELENAQLRTQLADITAIRDMLQRLLDVQDVKTLEELQEQNYCQGEYIDDLESDCARYQNQIEEMAHHIKQLESDCAGYQNQIEEMASEIFQMKEYIEQLDSECDDYH